MFRRLTSVGWAYGHKLSQSHVYNFAKVETANRQPLTEQHIEKATSVEKLISGVNISRICQNPLYQLFMRKLTKLLLTDKIDDIEAFDCIEKLLTQMRKLSSSESTSDLSDLLNYQLLFKQLTRLLPKNYSLRGFQVRSTMVAESIPMVLGFEGCEPTAVALLHYMSTYSESSKLGMKKKMLSYFLRFNMSQKIFHNSRTKLFELQSQEQAARFHAESCAILLSCIQARETQSIIQTMIVSNAFLNLSKNFNQVLSFLRTTPLTQFYDSLKHQSQNHNSNETTISKSSSDNPELARLALPPNTQSKFLQAADIFIKSIKNDYKNMLHEITYSCEELFKYFYSVFYLSHDMKFEVMADDNEQNMQGKSQLHKDNRQFEQKGKMKQISLWKIASFTLQGLQQNRLFIRQKQKMYNLLTHKIIKLVKKYVANYALSTEIQKYLPVIIKTLALLPIDSLKIEHSQCPQIHAYMAHFVEKCVEKLPQSESLQLEIASSLIKLARLKKTLFISKQKWIKIFQLLVKQDRQFKFWNLYFFMASSGDAEIASCVPFAEMVSHLSTLRAELGQNYVEASDQSFEFGDDNLFTINQVRQRQASSSRLWDTKILRLQALLMLTNREAEMDELLKLNCRDSMIEPAQIEELFQSWMKNFTSSLIDGLENTTAMSRQLDIKLRPKNFVEKPVAYFGTYFYNMFIETECLYQTKLIKKVLSHQRFKNYILNSNNLYNNHTLPYIMMVMLGLADRETKLVCQQQYPIERIFPSDFKTLNIYKCHYLKQFINELCVSEQWEYLFFILKKQSQLFQSRGLYYDFIPAQQIYLTASASIHPPMGSPERTPIFVGDYSYGNLRRRGKIQTSTYCNINRRISKFLVQEFEQSRKNSFDNIISIAIFILSHLQELSYLDHQNYQIDPTKFIEPEDILSFQNSLSKLRFTEHLGLPILFLKLRMLGLLTQNIALNLLQAHFPKKINSARVFCLTTIGREKALSLKLIEDSQWIALETEIYKIANLLDTSILFLMILLNFSNPHHYQTILRLAKNIYNPIEKVMLEQALKEYRIKHNLTQSQANVQEISSASDQIKQWHSEKEIHPAKTKVFKSINQPPKTGIFKRNESRDMGKKLR